MLVTITQFAEERHEDRDTINAFIRKHPEIKCHVSRQGKNTVIDTESDGYKALEKQYPLPQLVQVIEDTESRQKLIKAQEVIIQLQGQLTEASKQIAQAEAMKLLLEDSKNQLEDSKNQLEKAENRLIKAEERSGQLEIELRDERAKIEILQNELQQERLKTWWQKLMRK